MTFLFKVLDDVPAPPEQLINAIDRTHRPGRIELGSFPDRAYPSLILVNARQQYPEFEAWVTENVTRHIVDAGVNYLVDDGTGESQATSIHSDGVRNYALLWDIESGGPDAELCFWQEKGQPVRRPPRLVVSDHHDQLELLGKIRLPQGKWTLVDGTILHSVRNLFSTRIGLQISLLNEMAVATVKNIGDISFLTAGNEKN
jgi:hypothetical protein